MRRPGQRPDKILKNRLKPIERLHRTNDGERLLLTDDQLNLGDNLGQYAAIRPQRL